MLRPNIIKVQPNINFTVNVYFEDGKVAVYDVKDKLDKGVFKELRDINVFMNTCKILNNTLAWDLNNDNNIKNCIDICPDTLYEMAK